MTAGQNKPWQRRLRGTDVCVSRLTLGVANFGSTWGPHWTLDKDLAKRLVSTALDSGISAVDTANVYNQGESEAWLGDILSDLGIRGRMTVSTKFGYLAEAGVPGSGGSGRGSMKKAVETSLRRLHCDTIDILYLHLWDRTTAIEETLDAAAELTASGHIRAFALSNVPAWYLGRADLLSRQRNTPRLAAVQLNYNLLTRHLESDFLDLLEFCEIDMISWGALANGLLSGRYRIDRDRRTISGSGRMKGAAFLTGFVDAFSPTSRDTLAELVRLAVETVLTPAQIALAWLLHREQPASVVIGVSNEKQLAEQIEAASVTLDKEVLDRLEAASRPSVPYPQRCLEPDMQVFIHGELGARQQ